MKAHRTLRVLVLTYETHVPPTNPRGIDLRDADWKLEHDLITALRKLGQEVLVLGVGDELEPIRLAIERWSPHIAFNLLDEFAGNGLLDHNLAGYLELEGVPYTGCNPRGLILARDKALTKKILAYHRLPVPDFWVLPRGRRVPLPRPSDYPLIVKSLTEEASLGISQASVVPDERRLLERVTWVHTTLGSDAIAEKYIAGRELYVGLVGNARVEALPVWELRFPKTRSLAHPIATRKVKWDRAYRRFHRITAGKARLPPAAEREIQAVCREAYRALGLSGYARMDLRLTEKGDIALLEANPNPQLARGEELATAAAHAGIDYETLISRILTLGLAWDPARLQVA